MSGFITPKNSPASARFVTQAPQERLTTRAEMERRTTQLASSLQTREASAFSAKSPEKKILIESNQVQRSNSFTTPSSNKKMDEKQRSFSQLPYSSPEKKEDAFNRMSCSLSRFFSPPDKDQPS